MKATLVLPGWIAHEIAEAANRQEESGAVLLVGIAHTADGLRLLGRELRWVPDDACEERTSESLLIASAGYVEALRQAERIAAVPLWVHTHPGIDGDPTPSERDEVVDSDLERTFLTRSGAGLYGSLIFSPGGTWFRFSGSLWSEGRSPKWAITRAIVVGPRLAVLPSVDAPVENQLPVHFDRQIRAFGGDIQRVLSQLRVGIVGCGGTGSAIAEQLVRLGIQSLLLIDPDALSDSNVTRVYGSTPDDVARPKVDILAAHLARVAPEAHIDALVGSITQEHIARRLPGCDVVYGCTDDNAGRLVLSRFSSHYITPVFDVGVLLSSSAGQLEGIDARVTILMPGNACLVCRNRIDLARAQAELLDPDERASLQAEGYAPELGPVDPAVVPYTSLVASFAVGELLERLIGYGPTPEPGELLIRCHDREVSTNSRLPNPRHYCNPAEGLIGCGDREPFLEQTWRAA